MSYRIEQSNQMTVFAVGSLIDIGPDMSGSCDSMLKAQDSHPTYFTVTPKNSSVCRLGPYSAKSRPDEPPQVPHIPAVLPAGLSARLPAAVRGPGPAGRRGVSPPAAGSAPPRQAGARRRRRKQDQEGPTKPHRVHRAAADGPGETLREAEVSVHA